MKISLILVLEQSYGNLENFLNNLTKQTYKEFELIIISSEYLNDVDNMIKIFGRYYEIKYIHSKSTDYVKNKNVGLIYRTSDIITFPNVNTMYSYTALQRVSEYLIENEKTILLCDRNDFLDSDDKSIRINQIDEYVFSDNFFVNIKNQDIELFDINFKIISLPELIYVYNLMNKGYELISKNTISIENIKDKYTQYEKSYIFGAINKYYEKKCFYLKI